LREYLDYEQREPCQFYKPVPQGFMRDGCRVVAIEPPKPAPVIEQPAPAPAPQPAPSPVLVDYKIFFDFDKATINPGAEAIINQIANEITRYNPSDVTVAGHTDTAGPSEYNQKLSLRRAQAVSDALTAKGVANRVINLEAHGQDMPAVPTPDGVAKPENRRVVVEFLR
jgi:outer membrane protein OmpA-like peptidoglycan-associated protein